MTLTRLFDEVSRARPGDVAVVSSAGTLTYGELRRRAEGVALALRAVGVHRGDVVGVHVPRSIESIAAVLGVLRAGAAYVPIDPNYPAERQQFIATDAGIAALVVSSELAPIPEWSTTLVDVDAPLPGGDLGPIEDAPTDLLNVLYTSGSTGRPKGVCGTHAALLNRVRWGWGAFPFAADEVVSHRTSLNFVDAGPELFSGLLAGVPTAILHHDEQADLVRFVAALRRHRVTRLTVVPSILGALLRAVPEFGRTLGGVRLWISSGEELTLQLLAAFRDAHPAATLVNLYGTTEVTGDVTCAAFAPGTPLPEDRVPLGRAIAGAELLVLDAHGQAVADGETGELSVGGPVLARGYHNRPQEDAMRFPRHAVRGYTRVFRTGDLVRRDVNGEYHYVGRTDNAVKIRGIRVDLEEIERALCNASPTIRDLAVVLAPGGQSLVAFVTPAAVDVPALCATAERLLPAVMNPGRYVPLAALPLLPNGKVDRRALALQVSAVRRTIPPDLLPRTPTERQVAELWAKHLRREDLGRDDSFAGLGGDSLGLAELMVDLERLPGANRIGLGLARDATIEAIARALDGLDAAPADPTAAAAAVISITPMGEVGARDEGVIAMLVQASLDPQLCAATELPSHLTPQRARAYCLASDGVVIRVDGEPAGAGIVQHHPNIGEGVEVPPGSVQLDEWLLPRWRGTGLLGEGQAWSLIADWLALRFDTEASVVWEDHVAMLAILRARGYTRLGRTWWTSHTEGDDSAGFCEVWLYDLRKHRAPSAR